jgi:hypothetical protein
VKIVAKRKNRFNPDEDFEGDFVEVQENTHGMKMTFEDGSECIINVCNCNN